MKDIPIRDLMPRSVKVIDHTHSKETCLLYIYI